MPNARLETPSTGATPLNDERSGRLTSVSPKTVDRSHIDTAVKTASRTSDVTASAVDSTPGEQEDADAGASAHPVHETDREGPERRPGAVSMGVAAFFRMCVHMRMPPTAVLVRVDVEHPSSPSDEESDCQIHDHDGDGRLSSLLNAFREVSVEKQHGQAEGDQGQRVTQPPRETQLSGPAGGTLFSARQQRGHGSEVIGIGGVAKAEQHGNHDDDPDRRPVGESGNSVVEAEHQNTLRECFDGEADPHREDEERAHGRECADERAVEPQTAERTVERRRRRGRST